MVLLPYRLEIRCYAYRLFFPCPSHVLSCTPMHSLSLPQILMHPDALACTLMHSHALPCTLMHSHALLCTLMHSHALLCTLLHSLLVTLLSVDLLSVSGGFQGGPLFEIQNESWKPLFEHFWPRQKYEPAMPRKQWTPWQQGKEVGR